MEYRRDLTVCSRWMIVIAAGVLMGLSLGVRHTQGLFMQPVVGHHGWTLEAFGFALALQNLVWGAAQPFTGMIADRFGSARVLFVGMMVYAMGLLFMADAATPVGFALSNGLLIGIALSGTAFGTVYGALSRIFEPSWRSWALAMAGAVGGLGQFCLVPVVQAWLGRMEWQLVAAALCVVVLVCAPLSILLRSPRACAGPVGPQQSIPEALREAFRHQGFWLLNLGFFACGFQLAFIATHLPAYLMDQGLSLGQAGTALALIALANVFGTYTCTRIGSVWRIKRVLAAIYAARSVAMLAFLWLPLTAPGTYVFAAVMGFLWLGTAPLTNELVLRIFGVRYIATLFGLVFFGHQVGGFFGVWLGAVAYDVTRSYDLLWLGSIVIGTIAALLHWLIDDAPLPLRAEGVA